ncbi:hypothetical protein ACHHRT_01565 [Desulfurivibrio sp. D14AmB]|uniref:hypothetical protein n=1 Tax=Desulfurivibrio sp. D14AmB TaxID=3374370 RepID=UPI00376EB22B
MKQNTPTTPIHEETRHNRKVVLAAMACCAVVLAAGQAAAFTAPVAGSFAYDLYDVGVNGVLKGPIGFVAGVGAMAGAAFLAFRQMILPAAGTVLGGVFMLKADAVVETLGMMVI